MSTAIEECPRTERNHGRPTIEPWEWIWQCNAEGGNVEVSVAVHNGKAYRRRVNHRLERTFYAVADRVDAPESEWLACDEQGNLLVGFVP